MVRIATTTAMEDCVVTQLRLRTKYPRDAAVGGQFEKGVVGQFDCGRVPRWKMTASERILAGWHERNTKPR
jgi:hypothetical protein